MDDNWDKGFINWSEYAENSKDLIWPFTPSPSFNPSNSEIIEIELSAEDEEKVQRAADAYEKTNGLLPREAVEVLYRAYLSDIRKYQREHDEIW